MKYNMSHGMIRFIGFRPNPPKEYKENGTANPPTEPQYEGIIFSDGTVTVRWRTQFKSHSVWNTWEEFFNVHGHPEYGTIIVWLDDIPICPDSLKCISNPPESLKAANTCAVKKRVKCRWVS